MINRTRNFRRLVVIGGLALSGLLGLGAGSTRAQQVDNLPCSTRRDHISCNAECSANGSPNFLADCVCLFDNLSSDPNDVSCPEGTTCCWNMPCEKWDGSDERQCLRGGGSPDGLTPHHCGWTVDSDNIGHCACVPPLVHSNYTITDFIVDNGDPLNAPFDCRCPFTTDEQWLRLDVCNPPGVSKLAVKLNFAKPLADSIKLQGTLAVPDGFAVAGATLQVSIGGVVKSFTLDANGKAQVGTDQAQLVVKAKKGVVAAQDAKLIIKLSKGSFATSLSDEGLVNATVKDVRVTMPVEIQLNGTMYAKAQSQEYTAKTGKTGKTK